MVLFKSLGDLTLSAGPRLGLHYTSFLFYNIYSAKEWQLALQLFILFFFFFDWNMFTSFCLLCRNSFSVGNFHKEIICYQTHPEIANIVSGSAQEKMLDWTSLETSIQAIEGFFSSLAKRIRLAHLFSQMVFLGS